MRCVCDVILLDCIDQRFAPNAANFTGSPLCNENWESEAVQRAIDPRESKCLLCTMSKSHALWERVVWSHLWLIRAIPAVSILSSKVFTFVVGKQKQSFAVHAAALAKASKVIDVLLNGEMKEAKEGLVEWPDMNVQTFLRFMQWAYTGTYDVPEPKSIAEEAKAAAEGASKHVNQNALTGLGRGTALTWQFKDNDRYPSATIPFTARPNLNSLEGYNDIFLCHAELYIAADMYDVGVLKQLALHRLHVTLEAFTLYPSQLASIVNLVLYVCENTRVGDDLCNMLAVYVACIAEDLAQANPEGLQTLIERAPSFAFEWMQLRLSGREERRESCYHCGHYY